MTLWGIRFPPLITITGSVSLSQFGLELILLVGGTFTDALSQTDHNCFFIIVVGCLTANTWQTEGGKNRTGLFHQHTHTHIYFFAVLPFQQDPHPPTPSVVESASREHQDFSLPKKPSGAPHQIHLFRPLVLGSPTMSPHSRGAVGPAYLPVWPAGWWLPLTPSLLTLAPSLRWPHHQYAWHFIVRKKGLRLACVRANVVWWICYYIHLQNQGREIGYHGEVECYNPLHLKPKILVTLVTSSNE